MIFYIKRHTKVLLGISIILLAVFVLHTEAKAVTHPKAIENREVVVYVDGKKVNYDNGLPYVDTNYRVMVPIRNTVEAVAAEVHWNEVLSQVSISKDNTEVTLTANEMSYFVNGQKKLMNTAMVYNKSLGTNFVPIRFVLEALGAEVNWEMVEGIDTIQITNITLVDKILQSGRGSSSLSGSLLLDRVAKYLEIPDTFYVHTDIEYFLYEPTITETMKADLDSYLANFQYAENVSVLTYHHILKISEKTVNFRNNSAVVTVGAFEQHLKLLYEHKYQAYDLSVLEEYIKGNINLPKKSVFITFDDGYLSNYEYAYPLLKQYNYKATIFAISNMIHDHAEPFDSTKLNFISWQEIEQYNDVFTLEAHTHDLHRLKDNVSQVLTVPYYTLIEDLRINKQLLHASYFAYPYGQFDENTIEALKSMDYRLAFTNRHGTVSAHSNPYQINRYGINPQTTLTDLKEYVGLSGN